MSKYKDCLVFVDANGKYCCGKKRICIGEGHCAQITLINIVGLVLNKYPTGDTDEAFIPYKVLDEGLTVITEPGIYSIDIASTCEQLDGQVAPEETTDQVLVCCVTYEKPSDVLSAQLLQQICDKLIATEPVNIAEILLAIQNLCDKTLTNQLTLSEVLLEVQALCAKMLSTNTSLEIMVKTLTEGFINVVNCLESIKEGQERVCEKLEGLAGDPTMDCPTCPTEIAKTCDVKWFLTYAQQDFQIAGTTIGGVLVELGDTTYPINGNSAPLLTAYKNAVVAFLENKGIEVTEQQGRDGWTLSYTGPCPVVTTVGEGNLQPVCENCR